MWLKRGRMKPESEALVIAAQDQALKTRHYDKAVLQISKMTNAAFARNK